jgi:hypothetical protein
LGLALAGAAGAAPGNGDFSLTEKAEILPEMGRFERTVLTCQGREFGFLRPPGWSLVPEAAARQITFRSRDYAVTLVMRLRFEPGQQKAPASPESLLQQAQRLCPQATLAGRFPCYANSLRGEAFDFRETVGNGLAICHRVALVPFDGGVADFLLTSTAAQATGGREALGAFLASFTCEAPAAGAKRAQPE